MAVSRLDHFQLLTNFALAATTGASAGESPLPFYPLNGLVSVHFWGNFGSGTASLEVTPDGANWVPVSDASPASLTAPGILTWKGVAYGIRAKITGATGSPSINAIAVFQDQN
jgi:hypothetical protein